MKSTEFDRDDILSEILTEYLDGELSSAETRSFEAYLDLNKVEKVFVTRAAKGKRVLEYLRKHSQIFKDSPAVSS